MTARARAPGSSANLGPGFDVLAIAFDIHCRVEARLGDRWVVTELGDVYEPAADSLVRRVAGELAIGPLEISITNEIPRARGLGSSAALATATAAAGLRASGSEPDSDRLFDLVRSLEGHDDNAAAAVYGGAVVATNGIYRRLPVASGLRFLAGVPDAPLETATAREVLASEVPRRVVARSLGRVVFLVEGLRTGSPDAFAGAAGDELHESPRAHLSPVTGALIAAARARGALHAAWSGAGPTALAITDAAGHEAVRAAMEDVLEGKGSVLELQPAQTGWA